MSQVPPVSWSEIRKILEDLDPGDELIFPRAALRHPSTVGGLPAIRGWRLPPALDGSSIHVVFRDGKAHIHLDRKDPRVDPGGHLIHDVLKGTTRK